MDRTKRKKGRKEGEKKIRSSFQRYLNELNYHITHIKNTPKKESGPPKKNMGTVTPSHNDLTCIPLYVPRALLEDDMNKELKPYEGQGGG